MSPTPAGGPRPIRLLSGREEFEGRVREAGLILADFSTTAQHLVQAAHAGLSAEPSAAATLLDFGLSFSHLYSGLPFDFSLQPGLVKLEQGVAPTTAASRAQRISLSSAHQAMQSGHAGHTVGHATGHTTGHPEGHAANASTRLSVQPPLGARPKLLRGGSGRGAPNAAGSAASVSANVSSAHLISVGHPRSLKPAHPAKAVDNRTAHDLVVITGHAAKHGSAAKVSAPKAGEGRTVVATPKGLRTAVGPEAHTMVHPQLRSRDVKAAQGGPSPEQRFLFSVESVGQRSPAGSRQTVPSNGANANGEHRSAGATSAFAVRQPSQYEVRRLQQLREATGQSGRKRRRANQRFAREDESVVGSVLNELVRNRARRLADNAVPRSHLVQDVSDGKRLDRHGSSRLDQIRFDHGTHINAPIGVKSGNVGAGAALGVVKVDGAAVSKNLDVHGQRGKVPSNSKKQDGIVGPGNGGDDFTLTFPRGDSDLYHVYAFGFDLLDDVDYETESLSIYGIDQAPLGVILLRELRPGAHRGSRERRGGTSPQVTAPGWLPGGKARALESETFVGVISTKPIGFASFDESSGTDSIGVAHFVFGYKSTHAEIYDYSAWVTLGAAITLALLLEHVVLRRVRRVSLVQALMWTIACLLASGGLALALWISRSWHPALLFSVCASLNIMLSGDNLLVFLLLIKQIGLSEANHLNAIRYGILASLGTRLLVLLFSAALIERFWWVMILFALFLLYSGVKLLLDPDGDAQPELSSSDDPHWTVSAIGGCVPLRWAEKHDDSCVAYEPSPPAARALVGCADDSRLEMPYGLDSEGFNTESGDMEDLDGTPALRRPLSMAFPRPASSPINAQSSTLRPSVSAFDAQKERAVRSDPRGQATDVAASYASSKNDRDRRCGGFGLTRLAVAVGGIVLCDLLFAFDSTPAMLSVTRVPFLLVASQAMSMFLLRPLYFMLAAITEYLDAMQQTLAVVLVLIALKMLAESAGFTVPLGLFFGVLGAWRLYALLAMLLRRRMRE